MKRIDDPVTPKSGPLLSALVKFDHITAAVMHLTVEQATAIRNKLGGRAAVRDLIKAKTDGH